VSGSTEKLAKALNVFLVAIRQVLEILAPGGFVSYQHGKCAQAE
jgi:Mn-dependent DtxR family transcriptional regulator